MELEIRDYVLDRAAKEFNGLIGFVEVGFEVYKPMQMRVRMRPRTGTSEVVYADLRIREFCDGVRQPRLVVDANNRGRHYWSRVPNFRFPTQKELNEERRLYPEILW